MTWARAPMPSAGLLGLSWNPTSGSELTFRGSACEPRSHTYFCFVILWVTAKYAESYARPCLVGQPEGKTPVTFASFAVLNPPRDASPQPRHTTSIPSGPAIVAAKT